MHAVKRVEIVIDYLDVPRLKEALAEAGIHDHTMIREAIGVGDRGDRAGDGLRGEFSNSYMLIACSDEEATRLVEVVRPLLRQVGGICLVSDAMWVKH
jgi:nitrogen regulatory protein PII